MVSQSLFPKCGENPEPRNPITNENDLKDKDQDHGRAKRGHEKDRAREAGAKIFLVIGEVARSAAIKRIARAKRARKIFWVFNFRAPPVWIRSCAS